MSEGSYASSTTGGSKKKRNIKLGEIGRMYNTQYRMVSKM